MRLGLRCGLFRRLIRRLVEGERRIYKLRVVRQIALRMRGDDAGDNVLMFVVRENPREVGSDARFRKLKAGIIARRDDGVTDGADLRTRSGGEKLYAVTAYARIVVGKLRDVDARNGFDFVT